MRYLSDMLTLPKTRPCDTKDSPLPSNSKVISTRYQLQDSKPRTPPVLQEKETVPIRILESSQTLE